MSNLQRMDLYQLRKSTMWKRSVIGLTIFALIYALFFVICLDKEINAWFLDKGMIFSMNFKGELTLSLLGIYQKFLSSGFFIGVILIVYGSILYAEYQDGFIKHIKTADIDEKQYVISKVLKAGVMNLIYFFFTFLMFLLVCLLFPSLFQMDALWDILGFLGISWLLTTSLCAIVFLLMMCLCNKTVILIYAILLGSGILTTLEMLILSTFHIEEWMNYDVYYRMLDCPITTSIDAYLSLAGLGVGVIMLCMGIGYYAFKKKDIA